MIFPMMLLILFIGNGNGHKEECPLWFDCGNHGRFEWPFTKVEHQDCGIWPIHGCDDDLINPNYVLLKIGPSSIKVQKFEMQRFATIVYFTDHHLRNLLQSDSCEIFSYNITLPPSSPLGYFTINNNITLFKCNRTLQVNTPKNFGSLAACSMVQLPMNGFAVSANPFAFLTAEISVQFLPSDECMQCHHYRGHCHLDSQRKVNCAQRLRRCKRQYGLAQTQLQSRNTRIDPYEKSDSMTDRIFFGVPVFSYKELQEATNNFDHKTKLGEGGFGSVYYGKLQDGREVAVKHLFEHNYKRVQQFMNEIEILTHLRHRNLVSLYGCTSRHSRELLLVYEYVPNGTLAYHLHERDDSLTWPIRMQIAIETATALAYLHASDIIHRDVKTSNILLDNNFWVKVADFGLSRLLPNDVSHVSTAPQGTPGYLDPEYFQHYQLTDKSDVYSFGVVLVELISSMPALDAAREIDEINLANLAIKRIQNGKLGELVAKSLGFDSDQEVTRTLASVAELAFSVCAGGPAIKTLHG
ncbi:Putative serine/threonine-protein kinase [Glycine soja]|uniref:Putative serine/threonine-protein kinase n=1 Tax=Glycine soja TaxID=3848 RepID=A0A0B2R639_GLYSO|nr:Putative serine/threonine-protein kinase [Glycine soja]